MVINYSGDPVAGAGRRTRSTVAEVAVPDLGRLEDALAALGMPTAFDETLADFSGMTTQERLYISTVLHQAFIAVDEWGTEAAAATAVAVNMASAPRTTVTLLGTGRSCSSSTTSPRRRPCSSVVHGPHYVKPGSSSVACLWITHGCRIGLWRADHGAARLSRMA